MVVVVTSPGVPLARGDIFFSLITAPHLPLAVRVLCDHGPLATAIWIRSLQLEKLGLEDFLLWGQETAMKRQLLYVGGSEEGEKQWGAWRCRKTAWERKKEVVIRTER